MSADPQVNHLDFVSGKDATGPAGTVRVTRGASGLQASVDGGAPGPIGASGVATVTASAGASVNNADPANPIVGGDKGTTTTIVGAAVTDMSVSGLTGDTDGGYEVTGWISLPGSGTPQFYFYANGADPTGATSNGLFSTGAAAASNGIVAHLYVGEVAVTAEAGDCAFCIRLGSKQGIQQFYTCQFWQSRTNRGDGFMYTIVGSFNMGAQITSVGIHTTVASQIGVGSFMRVRKIGLTEGP